MCTHVDVCVRIFKKHLAITLDHMKWSIYRIKEIFECESLTF